MIRNAEVLREVVVNLACGRVVLRLVVARRDKLAVALDGDPAAVVVVDHLRLVLATLSDVRQITCLLDELVDIDTDVKFHRNCFAHEK